MTSPRRRAATLALAVALAACGAEPPSPPEADGSPAAETGEKLDAEGLEALRALGYVDVGEPLSEDDAVGVRVFDRARAEAGLNLFTDAKACATHLMDMEGTVHHTWSTRPCFRWDNTVLTPDGDLLVVARDRKGRSHADADAARSLVRLSWDGEIRWKRPLTVHHDVELTPDGRILALAHRFRRIPAVHPRVPVREHLLLLLSPDGTVLAERSLWEMLRSSPAVLPIEPVEPRRFEGEREVDLFHSNSVEWLRAPRLAEENPLYGPDKVLVTIRNQDAFVIFDWNDERPVWAWGAGEMAAPHDATLLPGGNILGFDNGMGRGWSRVVEVDPRTGEIVWEYRAPDPGDFYSETRGAAQRLSGGNTLVTESGRGRAFEVTADGEVVWDFVNPALTEKREPGVIVRMRRFEGLEFADLVEKLRRGEPLPRVD